MSKGQKQLTKTEKPVTINATKQVVEQKEKDKPAGSSMPVPVEVMSDEQNITLQQNQALVQRMAESFNPINARKAMPDAEVVQTAGKSKFKIKKEKKKLARDRNSVADNVSYDLKLEANKHLTAVPSTLNSVINADHIDMTKEENVYRCAIAQSFMKETENDEDKAYLHNFLSDDTDTRSIAFNKMVESMRSIKITEEKMSTKYVLSHLGEVQNIIMRVEAFSNFWDKTTSNPNDESSRKDSQLFRALDFNMINMLQGKITMGHKLENILQCALLQKGLRYVNDPDSPFGDPENKEKYEGLYQTKKLDYCSKEDAKNLSRQAGKQAEKEIEELKQISAFYAYNQ